MPYPVHLNLQFVRLKFVSGGDLIVPLTDQQALQIHEVFQTMAKGYLNGLQQSIQKSGRIEDLLEEQIPGPLIKETLEVEFPASTDGHTHPEFSIEFDVVFNSGPHQYWGLIPVLGLESMAKNEVELLIRLEAAVRSHFHRKRGMPLLEKVISSIWHSQTDFLELPVELYAPLPWEWGTRQNTQQASWLMKVAEPLEVAKHQVSFHRQEALKQLKSAVHHPVNKSTIIIGASGSGKTALIYQLNKEISGETPLIWETTAARLIKELTTDQGWQDNIAFLLQELKRLGVFLYVRQLKELFEIGQYQGNNVSIAEYLIPSLNRGDFHLISECTPADQSWIERKSPGYFQYLNTIKLGTLGAHLASAIHKKIQQEAGAIKVLKSAVEEAIDLHKRFFPYAGEPGHTIRFFQNLLGQSDSETTRVDRKKVVRFFSAQSQIPAVMIDPSLPFKPKEIAQGFSQQVFGQTKAVEGLTDMLGAVKNQLVRPDKPIASFLFIGPTGVGKTELAKVLAKYMFGNRDRMIRFDISEYSSPAAVYRLTGLGGGLLTSTIRRNPFCVLLFDELEKAHQDFFDLLLQILGEGRLTDQNGQVVNFCSTIIIMTSNIGASASQNTTISLKKGEQQQQMRDHFLREVQKQLRPELFNRIDRVIPFDALPSSVMRQVVLRELELLKKREGIEHRRMDLNVRNEVVDYLAIAGYDKKLGARQLQRCIRQELIIPLSKALNQADAEEHIVVDIILKNGLPTIELEIDPLNVELWLEEYEKVTLIQVISDNRRDIQSAKRSNLYIQYLSELDILKRLKSKQGEAFWKDAEKSKRYSSFLDAAERLERLQGEIELMEEEISLASFNLVPYKTDFNDRISAWKDAFFTIKKEVYFHLHPNEQALRLHVYGKNPIYIIRHYEQLFEQLDLEYDPSLILWSEEGQGTFEMQAMPFDDEPLPDSTFGWEAIIKGAGVQRLLKSEHGLVEVINEKNESSKFLVFQKQPEEAISTEILRKETYLAFNPRRILKPTHIQDSILGINREFGKEGPEHFISEVLKEKYIEKLDNYWK